MTPRTAGALLALGLFTAPAFAVAPPSPPALPAFDATAAPVSAAAQAGIPAGVYPIGSADGAAGARPAHRVGLGAFRMDCTEVTNAAFAEFLNALPAARPDRGASAPSGRVAARHLPATAVALLLEGAAGGGAHPLIALEDEHARIAIRDGRFIAAPRFADHPVTETTWRGGRLPTEVE